MQREVLKHFILVHGAGHGAWCWYKVATMLRFAGYLVTLLDLGASGINPKQISDLDSAFDYAKPLLEVVGSLPIHEKAIVVGHSFGGTSLALAMERFPEKFSAAVFVSAVMPRAGSPPIDVINELFRRNPIESFMDTQFSTEGNDTALLFGPNFMASKVYQLSPPEDLTLALTLIRWAKLFQEDLSSASILSEEKYGSVNRVYIELKEDELFTEDFSRWLLEYSPVKEVKEIQGADHMVMFSKPRELSISLMEIANTYH